MICRLWRERYVLMGQLVFSYESDKRKIFTPDQRCGPTALFTPLITSHESCNFLRSTLVPSVAFSTVNMMSSLPKLTICSSWASPKHSPYPFLMHCSDCSMLSQNKVSLVMLSFHILWRTYTFHNKRRKYILVNVFVLKKEINIHQKQTVIIHSFERYMPHSHADLKAM